MIEPKSSASTTFRSTASASIRSRRTGSSPRSTTSTSRCLCDTDKKIGIAYGAADDASAARAGAHLVPDRRRRARSSAPTARSRRPSIRRRRSRSSTPSDRDVVTWPITIDDVRRAAERIRPHLAATALRDYAPLDATVGGGISVLVKHENHQPTNAFKVRNAVSAVAALDDDQRRRGVIAATRGNHGAGLAWAARRFGVACVVVVPHGNNAGEERRHRRLRCRAHRGRRRLR